ncbi:MAG: PEP/pyruvate-binding domain-containing protein [Candidatus Xenobiia bacterium LiM19]
MTCEEERAHRVFLYLEQYPDYVRSYIRRLMKDTLIRDEIVNEFSLKKMIGKRALEIQSQEGGKPFEAAEVWLGRCREARKQIVDYLFSINYSIDRLKQIIVDHSTEIESEFAIKMKLDFDFHLDIEKASTKVLIEKMKYFESLTEQEKLSYQYEMRELKIVLIRRLITEIPEQVNITERFLSMEDMHEIYNRFTGTGKVGGKSAGILIAHKIVQCAVEEDPFNFNDYINVPESFYVGDEVCIDFIDFNGLLRYRNQKFKPNEIIEREYEEIKEKIHSGRFPDDIWNRLRQMLEGFGNKPIIVRSSSLLEDNIGTSFAGKYDSFFLPNQGTLKENLHALGEAIKRIYSGIFSPEAIIYRKRSKMQYDYESMAILIQEVVGTRTGKYFFPHIAGVIFSENPFLWSGKIRKEDGMIRMVYGLGTRAVDRVGEDYPRMVSLTIPEMRPESQEDIIRYSQKYVDVIDMENNCFVTRELQEIIDENPDVLNRFIHSIKTDDLIRHAVTTVDYMHNPAIITFDRLLSRTKFPQIIRAMIDKIKKFYGYELDMEFAGNIEKDGRFRLYILQCRPQSTAEELQPVEIPDVPKGEIIFNCAGQIPSGKVENIDYIVYVDPEQYDRVGRISDRYEIARLVGRINTFMENHTSILLGPGRWGSNNIQLGVPVKYNEINNFRLLGEIARMKSGIVPEVSFGTHFFQDLVETGIYCIPIYPDSIDAIFNKAFMSDSPNFFTSIVKNPDHYRFENIIKVISISSPGRAQVLLNGKLQRGLCFLASS